MTKRMEVEPVDNATHMQGCNTGKHIISSDQFMLLQGFMLYVWNVNHGDEDGEYYGFWAEQLDNADISWYVQNTAAYVMSERENGWKYFRTLLQGRGIYLEQINN